MTDLALAPRANARASFSESIPNLQIAFDSVSLGAAKKCLRYYQLSIVEGWTHRGGRFAATDYPAKAAKYGGGSSLHLRFGILYHRAMEFYSHARAAHFDHEEALRQTVEDLLIWCVEPDGSWWDPSEGLNEKQAKENSKTLPALFRTVVWYLDAYVDDPLETVILANGQPAVELSFRYEVGLTAPSGEPYLHAGHIDRLVSFNGDKYFVDWKTSKNTINQSSSYGYFAQFSPNNQMTGYYAAGRIALGEPIKGGIINAAQIAKGFSRFERGFLTRTDEQLEEWITDTRYWIRAVERAALTNYWPMNDTSCSDYGGCIFRGICSKDPSVRHIFLESDFEKRPWDPFAIRGDI